MDEIRERKHEFLRSILGNQCVKCNVDCRWMLQYDHVDSASRVNGSQRVSNMSFEALKTEVTKMQMLCTNCHALKTFTADVNGTGILSTEKETVRLRERLDRLREPYSQQKMATGCEWPECEFVITLPAQLHHDHIDPATKKVDVGHMYNMKGFTPEFGNAEVAKCKVLCGNHHAVRTMLQMNGYCVWKSGFPSGDISEFVADVRTKRRAASEAAAIAAAAAAATAKAAKTDSDDNDDSDDDSDIDDE